MKIRSKAIAYARNIGDLRAESFALTALGEIYFWAGDSVKAMQLAQSSAFAAQQVNAADSLYRAQALAGRINKKSGFICGSSFIIQTSDRYSANHSR